MTIWLNLAANDPLALMHTLQAALRRPKGTLRIELLGPGFLIADTALILFEILRKRPDGLAVHVHAWSCLIGGSVLVWLAGDSRSIRSDAWIEIPEPPGSLEGGSFCRAVAAVAESPADTDLRTVLGHMDQWLPVAEVAGMRLFEPDLRELGLLDDEAEHKRLAEFFMENPGAA